MAGEHDDAISRIHDLIAVRPFDPTFYVIQARERSAIISNILTFAVGIYVLSPWELVHGERQLQSRDSVI